MKLQHTGIFKTHNIWLKVTKYEFWHNEAVSEVPIIMNRHLIITALHKTAKLRSYNILWSCCHKGCLFVQKISNKVTVRWLPGRKNNSTTRLSNKINSGEELFTQTWITYLSERNNTNQLEAGAPHLFEEKYHRMWSKAVWATICLLKVI